MEDAEKIHEVEMTCKVKIIFRRAYMTKNVEDPPTL